MIAVTPELVAALQEERERGIAEGRLARLAREARACCSVSGLRRIAAVLRAPARAVRR